jgi:hypothetical protein
VSAARPEHENEVDQLLLNARLRDELEPFLDESVEVVNTRHMPTHLENEYLASMLAWERAPVLPISRWFHPELKLPAPERLSDRQLSRVLAKTIAALYEKQIVLEFTEHLSDRELYRVIFRDILPSHEKKLERTNTYLHWQCIDVNHDPDVWLRYYASEEEREGWQAEFGGPIPPAEKPPYPRRSPRWPL